MSIKFYPKPFGKSKNCTVTVRILYNRTKAEFSTGIRCRTSQWNFQKEEFNSITLLNQKLADLKGKIYRAKHELDETGRFFTAKDIIYKVDSKKKKNSISLLGFYSEYITKKTEEGRSASSTIAKYVQTYKTLEGFLLASRQTNYMVKEVEFPFIIQMDEYLKNLTHNEYGDKLSLSSVWGAHFAPVLGGQYKTVYYGQFVRSIH